MRVKLFVVAVALVLAGALGRIGGGTPCDAACLATTPEPVYCDPVGCWPFPTPELTPTHPAR